MAAPDRSTAELSRSRPGGWFDIELARTKMLSAQVELLDRLSAMAAESNIE
jgi:predicted NUDIX family NTP pyrophosphohydrolase